jgi:secreted PhoX family phosphatase
MVADRRAILRRAFLQIGALAGGGALLRCSSDETVASPPETSEFPPYDPPAISPPTTSNIANVGALLAPDANGLMLPAGFSARIVARSTEVVEGTSYTWHAAPDGGATFLDHDGGYVYVSNSEVLFDAGVGALKFDADGTLLDAYRILSGTQINCAGGPTPWGTWLSCEERSLGQVFECDPFGKVEAIARPALGLFKHEAVTVDPIDNRLYLTEDQEDGRFYRYTPNKLIEGRPDLRAGKLEVMQIDAGIEGPVSWLALPDPSGAMGATKDQVAESTAFDGGEGIWWHEGVVYFTTKGDNRVWAYDTNAQSILVLYDDDTFANPILSGVDNITITASGDILVAEDGGNMQIVAITDGGATLVPLVQIVGQDDSEITGPALDPYRKRLYFSSQRGTTGGILGEQGITYEITGPFFV